MAPSLLPGVGAIVFRFSATRRYNARMPRRNRISAGAASMDRNIPVVVRMPVECARCGHTEHEIYEFDMPFKKSQPMETGEPGKCPECGAPSKRCSNGDPDGWQMAFRSE